MSQSSGKFSRESDNNKVKIEDAIASSDWNARKAGYVAAATDFKKPDLRGKNWDLFEQLVKYLTGERNVPVLEKGLEAVLAFVENCSIVEEDVVQSVLNNVVKNGLSDVKPRIKELSNRICRALFDIKKYKIVTDMLLQGMEARNGKQALSCVRTLTNALIDYGPTCVDISAAATKAVALCQNKAMFQRDTKDLLREIYKWNGSDGTERYLKLLDASQRKAMEIEFSKVDLGQARNDHNPPMSVDSSGWSRGSADNRPKSARSTMALPSLVKTNRPSSTSQRMKKVTGRLSSPRSPQYHSSISSKKASERAGGDRPKLSVANQMGWEDILIMMENKQWDERKEAVDELYNRINSNTTINGVNYGKMIKRLRVLILEDTNVVLVSKAIKCVSVLAKSQNKEFRQHVPLMMTLLLEKFKDKKSTIIDSTRAAIDAIYLNFPFGGIARYVALSLVSPNPSVKAETALFVQRCFTRPTSALLKFNNWHPMVQGLVSNLKFPDQTVRESAMNALGTILKAVGEKALAPHMAKIPKHQMSMISKYSKKATVSFHQPYSRTGTETSVDIGSGYDELMSTSSTDQDLIRTKVDSLLPGFKAQMLPGLAKQDLDPSVLQTNHKNRQGQVMCDSDSSSDKSEGSVPTNGPNPHYIHEIKKTPGNSSVSNGRRPLSPAAQQKLASFQCAINQLKEASRNVHPDQPLQAFHPGTADCFGSIEEKITRKLQDLEGTVSNCFMEIRQLSTQLYKELEYSGNQSSGDVLRTFNQRLHQMERLLKSMAFEMCPSTDAATA